MKQLAYCSIHILINNESLMHKTLSWKTSNQAQLTNTHDHEKPRQKSSKINHTRARALHKVIWVRCATAYPVRQRCEDVGADDEESEVVFEKRGGEDDEEEADSEDLWYRLGRGWGCMRGFAAEADVRRRAR
jgi:hypothetical protein